MKIGRREFFRRSAVSVAAVAVAPAVVAEVLAEEPLVRVTPPISGYAGGFARCYTEDYIDDDYYAVIHRFLPGSLSEAIQKDHERRVGMAFFGGSGQ